MAPHGLNAPEGCSIGIRAELNACEADPDQPSRVPGLCHRQKNEFFTKDKLPLKRILEEVYRKHFPNVPLALPPFQLPNYIPSQADPKRASLNLVFSRPTEARVFERHATQRGCSFHSPELTVWTELWQVPSAHQAALAGRKVLL